MNGLGGRHANLTRTKSEHKVVGSVSRGISSSSGQKELHSVVCSLIIEMRDIEEDEEIERAIQYLVHSFESSGDNPKPVILHSTRVGMNLYNRNYGKRIIISGLLHDLLEDTNVTSDEIRSKFGKDVANIVEATSFDENIDGYLERHYDIYKRCFELGRSAVVVKATDILDNSDYYGLTGSKDLQKNQIEKMRYFIDKSEPYIGEEDIYQELNNKFSTVKERIRKQ